MITKPYTDPPKNTSCKSNLQDSAAAHSICLPVLYAGAACLIIIKYQSRCQVWHLDYVDQEVKIYYLPMKRRNLWPSLQQVDAWKIEPIMNAPPAICIDLKRRFRIHFCPMRPVKSRTEQDISKPTSCNFHACAAGLIILDSSWWQASPRRGANLTLFCPASGWTSQQVCWQGHPWNASEQNKLRVSCRSAQDSICY